eukprot:1159248-Pelagomonas_calceolata.AAC.6
MKVASPTHGLIPNLSAPGSPRNSSVLGGALATAPSLECPLRGQQQTSGRSLCACLAAWEGCWQWFAGRVPWIGWGGGCGRCLPRFACTAV